MRVIKGDYRMYYNIGERINELAKLQFPQAKVVTDILLYEE